MNKYHDTPYPPTAMLARDWEPGIVEFPVFIQYKLDGIRAFVAPSGMVYYGRNISKIPTLHGQFGVPGVWLDGEIYHPRWKLQFIAGLCRRAEADDMTRQLQFHAFDIIGSAPQHERLERLASIEPGDKLTTVTSYLVTNLHTAADIYRDIPEKIEGIMYRHVYAPYTSGRTQFLLKRKKLMTSEYKCVGVNEGLGKFYGTLGAFECVLADNTTTFKVSAAELTNKERNEMWSNPPFGKMLTIRYPNKSAGGIPLQAQFINIRGTE